MSKRSSATSSNTAEPTLTGSGQAETLAALAERARACTVCVPHLPHAPRPVLRVSTTARVLIVGQAPGRYDMAMVVND